MRSFKGKIGVVAVFVLSAIPVLLWITAKPLSIRFETPFVFWTGLGQLTGLIGMILFSLTLIMSARIKFLEDYFGGLDRMYNVHHNTGTIAFLFLLVHPLVLAIRFIPFSLYGAAQFLLIDFNDWPKSLGVISLLLVMALLIITFYAHAWKYQIRRYLHQTLGFVFFLGAMHSFLIPSDMSSNTSVAIPMLVFITLALFAFSYRTLFGQFIVNRYTYTVTAVNLLDETVTEVIMAPVGEHMQYLPGQFVFLSLHNGGISTEVHPFSISSSPYESVLGVTAKALGDYTTDLRKLRVGATAKVEGPFGVFSYLHGKNLNQIWIAGGIGITPFMNMARSLRQNKLTGHRVDFYYSAKTKKEMVFLNELQQIAIEYPTLNVIPYNADERGFLNMDAVQTISKSIVDKDIYVCGPPPMMHSIIAQCRAKGVPKALIHAEEFKLL